MDFAKIGELPQVEKLQDGDTVLVVRDGEVYRMDGSKVGGAGGYLLEPAEEEVQISSDAQIFITSDITNMLAVYNAGGHCAVKVELNGLPITAGILTLIDGKDIDAALDGIFAGVIIGSEMSIETIGFTNGQPVPSTTALQRLRGGKNVQL